MPYTLLGWQTLTYSITTKSHEAPPFSYCTHLVTCCVLVLRSLSYCTDTQLSLVPMTCAMLLNLCSFGSEKTSVLSCSLTWLRRAWPTLWVDLRGYLRSTHPLISKCLPIWPIKDFDMVKFIIPLFRDYFPDTLGKATSVGPAHIYWLQDSPLYRLPPCVWTSLDPLWFVPMY